MRRGAPEAVPVVDRFHLVQNRRQALEAFLLNPRPVLQAAAVCTAMALSPAAGPVPAMRLSRGRRRHPTPGPLSAERSPRHLRWVTLSEALPKLSAPGGPLATMARRLGISRPTVYADLRRDTPPGPRQFQWPPSARALTPSRPYLSHRWRESQADSVQRWRELQALGSTPSARTGGRFLTRLRRTADAGQPPEPEGSPYTRAQGPSARTVSCLRVCAAATRPAEAQAPLDQRCAMEAGMARA